MNRTYRIRKVHRSAGNLEVESVAKPIGNGAHVMVPRSWTNCIVRVILEKRPRAKKHVRRSLGRPDAALRTLLELGKLAGPQRT